MRRNSVSPPDPATPHSMAKAARLGNADPCPTETQTTASSICHVSGTPTQSPAAIVFAAATTASAFTPVAVTVSEIRVLPLMN